MTTTNKHHSVTRDMLSNTARVGSHASSENCLPIGTELAEFEITAIIGEGGFGTVYLATDRALQRTVAIKEYMPGALAARGTDKSVLVRSQRHQETFDIGLKSFINEARLLAQFDHPALIKVHRFWEENKTGYMAMRYYEGQTLKEAVRSRPYLITEASLKSILKPILEALDALYKVQVLHRDISPDNIMIQTSGEAVLLDFGAARQLIGDATQALTVILKPGYAPIEQYADDTSMKQGPWTDIYALSAVIYYCITKKAPATSVARMIKDPMQPLLALAPVGYSPQFLAAIDRGLCIKPDERPQTIEQFRQLLDISGLASTLPPPTASPLPAEIADPPLKPKTRPDPYQARAPVKPASAVQEPAMPIPRRKALKGGSRHLALRPILLFVLLALMSAGAVMFHVQRNRASAPAPIAAPVKKPPVSVPDIEPAAMLPATVPAGPAAGMPAPPDEEILAWTALNANPAIKIADLANFIQKYPSGKYTVAAQATLSGLTVKPAPVVPAPSTSPVEVTAPKAKATYTLAVSPWGKVSVDGVNKGVTPPLKILTLSEGKHQIRIANPNFPDYVTQVDVVKNSSGTIHHEFSPPTN